MKKLIALISLSIFMATSIFALSVDEEELKSTENQTIEFINYTGPHRVIDSVEAIRKIGGDMGIVIGKNVEEAATAGNKAKYYVIHAVDPKEKGKLDADILYLGPDAAVDHIVNLRRIIGGYLVAAYGYSEKDAETIAVFVTVYNAVYRGKLDDYKSKYKTIVIDNLTKEKCGLGVNWKDWAGKSEIVIPLFDVSGGISTVDTSVISDSKVVDSMKEDDDKNIDSRKDMVDIKEREAEKASEKAKESQKKATEEQKKLDEQKKKTTETQKKADESKKKADEAQKKADENPKDKKAQEDAKKAKEQAKQDQTKVEEQKQAEKVQEQKTEEAKEEAKKSQEQADKKITEAQEERKEIAKDQKEVQQKIAEQAKMITEIGLTLVDEGDMTSRLVKFNTIDGVSIKDSPVTTIRNRTAYKTSAGFIAIAGENVGNGTVKLVMLDSDKMEIINESAETVSEKSVLVKDGDSYYCVIQSDGNWVVAKYDTSLKPQLKSTFPVKESTPITITDSGVVVTGSNGRMRVLSKKDLKPLLITTSVENAK